MLLFNNATGHAHGPRAERGHSVRDLDSGRSDVVWVRQCSSTRKARRDVETGVRFCPPLSTAHTCRAPARPGSMPTVAAELSQPAPCPHHHSRRGAAARSPVRPSSCRESALVPAQSGPGPGLWSEPGHVARGRIRASTRAGVRVGSRSASGPPLRSASTRACARR